jgi:hypothetical protein
VLCKWKSNFHVDILLPAGKGHGCVMWLNKFVKSVCNFLAFYGRDGLFLSLFFLPPFLHFSAPEIWQGST